MRSVEERYRSPDVRIFRLDAAGVVERLRARAEALLRTRPDVLEVRLFGSLARGAGGPGSDADLFVLVRDDGDDAGPIERAARFAREFEDLGVGCDVVAWTESDLARARGEQRRFARMLDTEAITLARRA